MGTVGPNHLVTILNSGLRIQNRTGGVISTVSLATFWSKVNVSPILGLYDVTVQYDPYGKRFIVTTAGGDSNPQSAVFVGVSQTSDPTGGWNLYRFAADPTGQTWADGPKMGFNKTWVAVTFSRVPVSTGSISRALYVLDKSKLYAGTAVTPTEFTNDGSFSVYAPAVTYDAALAPLYLARPDQMGSVLISEVSGAVGAETVTQIATVTDPTFTACCSTSGPQLGSSIEIGINGFDLQHAVFRNGSIWMVFTVPGGQTPARLSLHWWQVTPSGTLQQLGAVDDPTGAFDYGFSSLSVNKNNDVLIGYTRFGSSQYPSANYAFRAGTDAPNTLRGEVVLKAGEAPFNQGGSPPCCARWGDYSNTVVDPANDTDLWTIQEYSAAKPTPGATWGTWWGRVTPPSAGTAGTFINAGGPAGAPFVADSDFTGGSTIRHANVINLTGVTNPAPMVVYQDARIGNFSYTIGGFTPGTTHTIRLHFAETFFSTPGSRVFDVSINGATVLSRFDIVKAAGAKNKAIVEAFSGGPTSAGQYVIKFTSHVNSSLVSGIAIQ
jgi:hypothetical protein